MKIQIGFPAAALAVAISAQLAVADPSYTLFESDPVRPVALAPDGSTLFVCNIPDGRLEVFDLTQAVPVLRESVPVGLEPVAVAARTSTEAWVVNQLSDSVSIVDCSNGCRVVRTLFVGDEPRDIVFAGPGGNRAFITAAHRGQHYPSDPHLELASEGRADTWVFDALDLGGSLGGDPLAVLSFFGDTTRPLAASADGSSVYAAVFRSGNQTTLIPGDVDEPSTPDLICPGGASAGPCEVVSAGSGIIAPGGHPAPNENGEMVPAPHTSLIVRFNEQSGAFEDELSRDWTGVIPYSLPDCDVAHIDANANPPAFVNDCVPHVGTINLAMAVNPVNGNLYVANTEARNEVRFEPNVRGHLHESRITVVTPAYVVSPRHLNKHIDYAVSPAPSSVNAASLATPIGLAVSSDGARLYVAAFGSQKIGVFQTDALENDTFTPSPSSQILVGGGGPTGLVLDEPRDRLYTVTRFDDSLRTVDLLTSAEIAVVPLHDPEPDSIKLGRSLFYDATNASSNGEASCSSCHVFGHLDGLAWDLGDPDGPVVSNPIPQVDPAADPGLPFHPMKGPFLTQTFRGMTGNGPMHWRGDRFNPLDVYDEVGAFKAFNPAFVSLLGRDQPLTDAEMQAFADFALQLIPGPSPTRNLDDVLTAKQAAGEDFYRNFAPPGGKGTCVSCHELDASVGIFGTVGLATSRVQSVKIPHLRMMYERVGYPGYVSLNTCGAGCPIQPAVRGFGANSDGSAPTSFEPPNVGTDLGAFVLAYPTNLATMVGQQVTIADPGDGPALDRIDLMLARADDGACDVVVKGWRNQEERGWIYDPDTLLFDGDRVGEELTYGAMVSGVAVGSELTFTCTPPGSGHRLARDRDEDGWYDRDELDIGTDPADASSVPLDFAIKLVKVTRLTKANGTQRLKMRGGGTQASVADFDVSTQPVRVALSTGGSTVFDATVEPGSPDWRVSQTRWRWKKRLAVEPNGLSGITLSIKHDELIVKVAAADASLEDLSGVPGMEVTVAIGADAWHGPSPACSMSNNGNSLRCR